MFFLLFFLSCLFFLLFLFSFSYLFSPDFGQTRNGLGWTLTDPDRLGWTRTDLDCCASHPDSLISLSYSMAAFSTNSFERLIIGIEFESKLKNFRVTQYYLCSKKKFLCVQLPQPASQPTLNTTPHHLNPSILSPHPPQWGKRQNWEAGGPRTRDPPSPYKIFF